MPATEHAVPAEAASAQYWPAGQGLSVADTLPVPTQKPAAQAPVQVATVRPVVAPYLPAGLSVGEPAFARQ